MRAAFGLFVLLAFGTVVATPAVRAAPRSAYLEDLTWTEVRDALSAGSTTIIIPVGGTEQSGPQLALGKHNIRVRILAGRIATALGDTLVAPVLAYVPEGSISPPSEHMRFPGTISVSVAAFKGTLEGAARSLRQAGFRHIVLIGDHGGYQTQLKEVADQLNKSWAGSPAHVDYIAAYYRATEAAYNKLLRAQGLSEAEIGLHAGAADTSLQLAVDPTSVRSDRLDGPHGPETGVLGDPRRASAALGQLGIDLIVSETVTAIRKARQEKH